MSERIYLITAIPYVNAKPHLGHALELILGDAMLRFYRKNGFEVLGQTGTDEYGQKLFKTAINFNRDPKEYCDEYSEHFRALKKTFSLSYDQFIRTTEERHHLSAQKIWQSAMASGDIYKKKYQGLYCTGCESFKTEQDLIDGLCPNHNKAPELVSEENYFFRLSRYEDQIRNWLLANPKVVFPETRYNEILSILNSGLEDISISRPRTSLNWGVPVPGDPDHVMYVWFDALTNYITGVGYENDQDKFGKWWQADDAKTIHLIGKDIIRHHIAIWPGMLLSAGVSLPKQYVVHGFVLTGGQKMSKTLGNIVDPVEIAEKYGIDALRWYLLKEIPNGQDGDFLLDRFFDVYNADLANNLGNLFNRVLTLLLKYSILIPETLPKIAILEDYCAKYNEEFSKFYQDKAAGIIIQIANLANGMIEEEKPWVLAKEDPDKLQEVMIRLFSYLVIIADLIEPFLPDTYLKMKLALGIADHYKYQKIDVLFPRIEKESVN